MLYVMIKKKTKRTNLENKRVLFFEMGMTIVLAAMLAAFEWASATPEKIINNGTPISEYVPDVIVPVTRTPEPKPPVPVFPKLNIVENNPEIPDPDFIFNVSATEDYISDITKVWTGKGHKEKTDDIPLLNPEKMPSYHHGGLVKFRDHIQQIVKYPDDAIAMGIEGKVFVQFVVDKQGKISNIRIIKGVCPLLDNAVIDAIKNSDRWEPGMQMGRPVSVAMSMPVSFRLTR